LTMTFSIKKSDALIIVDVQRDFCPGGALPVPEGDQVVPVLNKYIEKFTKSGARIFATRDWHPPNHVSFKPYGGPWPPHCVQGSRGAEFHPELRLPEKATIISKATDPKRESYSGFDGTDLERQLRTSGVKRVFVGGLATDYCVKNTVLDALKSGFETILLADATRGIDKTPGGVQKAVKEMASRGTKRTTMSEVTEPK
jgi:nicotinamidase/pyrazinamidase